MEPFIGQIMMFAGNFAPRGWAKCDGQLLQIAQYSALFSILGTTYGGDGRTTFGLPELRGRSPLHAGTGPGLPEARLGAKAGAHQIVLNVTQIPSHSHTGTLHSHSTTASNLDDPDGAVPGLAGENIYSSAAPNTTMSPNGISIANTGGNQPFVNYHPYQVVTFVIALTGVFPSRS